VEHFNGSLQVQAQQALRGGTDLNCGALYGEQNAKAVSSGLIKEAELDVALGRIYSKAFALGIIDQFSPANPNPYATLGAEAVDTPTHRQLALEGGRQGLVLLKNADHTLPLHAADVKRLALIGPHANGSTVFLGGPNYHGDNTLVNQNTPLLRARAWLPAADVAYAVGCAVSDPDQSGFDEAVAAAAKADHVVVFLGSDSSVENEAKDRDSITLPGAQEELALKVAAAAAKPIIVVLANGGPLAIRALKESPKVGAIIEAFFPGQVAAEPILELLLGRFSPSGLMPVTVYDADFVKRRPITNLDLRGAGGVTYRYFTGKPLWPFGFGLSYTDFSFSGDDTAVVHTTVAAAKSASLCFSVHVKNAAGGMPSDVVVLGFIKSDHADAPPNPKLCDFVREAAVRPAEQREVKLCVGAALPLVSEAGEERVLPGEYVITVGVKGGVGGVGAGSVVGKLNVAP